MESTRKKSCVQCRLSKTRCSLDLPTCSRCAKRKIACKYEHRQRSSAPGAGSESEGMFHSWLIGTNPVSSMASDSLGGSERISELEFQMPTETRVAELFVPHAMDWNNDERDGSTAGLLDMEAVLRPEDDLLQRHENTNWFAGSNIFAQKDIASFDGPPTEVLQANANDDSEFLPEVSNAMKTSSKLALASWEVLKNVPNNLPNILERLPAAKVSDMLRGNVIWSKIETYVVTFEKAVLPPFIHCTVVKKDSRCVLGKLNTLPETLENAENLVSICAHQSPTISTLVLKSMMLEIQRLHVEFQSYDEMNLLHALQALTIYVILMARDKMSCTLPRVMARLSMGEVATAVQKGGHLSTSESRGNFPTWDEWLLQESKRRVLIVLHLMDRIIDTSVGPAVATMCHELDKIPLPCSKAMWEASNLEQWETEYKTYLTRKKRRDMLTCGDLRRTKDSNVSDLDGDIVKDLSNWSQGSDELGSLLVMALS